MFGNLIMSQYVIIYSKNKMYLGMCILINDNNLFMNCVYKKLF